MAGMTQVLKRIYPLLTLGLIISLAFALSASAELFAQSDSAQQVIAGAGETGGANASSSISDLIATILNILSWVAGVISVFMIIIAGIRFALSGGDSGAIASARNTIIYALVGLAVVALAQVIVRFVINNVVA